LSEVGDDPTRKAGVYVEILTFTTNLEHVGDIIDKKPDGTGDQKIKNRYNLLRPKGLRKFAVSMPA